MSPITSKFAVLALAGSAFAIPNYGHGHVRQHHHHNKHFYGSSGVATGTGSPYGFANATGIWGTGTGVSSHGLVASTGLATGAAQSSAVAPESASEVAPASTSTCTDSVVRVTHTNRVTVTVMASDVAPAHTTLSTRVHSESAALNTTSVALNTTSVVVSSSAVVLDTASEVAPSSTVASSSASASVSLDLDALQNKGYYNKAHHKSTASSTVAASTSAAQSTSKSSAAAVSTQASSSTSVYVAPSSSAAAASSSAKASSTSSAASQSSGTSNGKRGLAYNTASLMTCFENNDQITWAYNWGSSSSGLSSSFNYVPLLWGTSSDHTGSWSSDATNAISNGATHLMSFNEPDMSSQSNLSPSAAAAAYKTYMMPFAGKAKLGAPAVTNGGGSMGLNWLSAFIDACDGCQIDFVSIHWYDSYSNTAYFKEQVQNATDVAGGKPVWVTEFAPTDGSDSDVSTFLEDVMPWMDSQSFVERYSFFMAADGKLISGTEPSSTGETYMS